MNLGMASSGHLPVCSNGSSGPPSFPPRSVPQRVPDRLPVILIGKVPLARLSADEEEVAFPVLHLRLLLNDHHETLLIIEIVPS